MGVHLKVIWGNFFSSFRSDRSARENTGEPFSTMAILGTGMSINYIKSVKVYRAFGWRDTDI